MRAPVIQLHFLLSATTMLFSPTLILFIVLELATLCPQMGATSCMRIQLMVTKNYLNISPSPTPPPTEKTKSLCSIFKDAVAISRAPHFYLNFPVLLKNKNQKTTTKNHNGMRLGCWHYSTFWTSLTSFYLKRQPAPLTVSLASGSHKEKKAE